MKKIITLVCTIACIFGLTACGSEPEYTAYEKEKLSNAEVAVEQTILPCFQILESILPTYQISMLNMKTNLQN